MFFDSLHHSSRYSSGSHTFLHPAPEWCQALFGLSSVTWHAYVLQALINDFGLVFHFGVGGRVESELFHRVHVGGRETVGECP